MNSPENFGLSSPVISQMKESREETLCPIGHLADEQTHRDTIHRPQPCADLGDSPAGPLQKVLIILRCEGFPSTWVLSR